MHSVSGQEGVGSTSVNLWHNEDVYMEEGPKITYDDAEDINCTDQLID